MRLSEYSLPAQNDAQQSPSFILNLSRRSCLFTVEENRSVLLRLRNHWQVRQTDTPELGVVERTEIVTTD